MKRALLNLTCLIAAGLIGSVWAAQPIVPKVQNIQEQQVTMKKSNQRQVIEAFPADMLAPRTVTAATIPFTEDFEGITPENRLPAGWTVTDNATPAKMNGGAIKDFPGHSGDYYLVSGYDSNSPRNGWAFTPGLELMAGTKYYVTVYAYVPGYGETLDEFKITVGSAATQASQTEAIIDYTGSKAASFTKWTKVDGEFTPSASGTYYFGINHCTSVKDANTVAFDDFSVTLEPIREQPEAKIYSTGGLWSFVQDTVYVAPGQTLDFGAEVEAVTSYAWSVDGGATPASSSEAVYPVTFPGDGQYTVSLTASNSYASVDKAVTYNVVKGNVGVEDAVCNMKSDDKLTAYNLGANEYVGGLNKYYTITAEKYELPANVKGKISGIYIYVFAYKFSAAHQSENVNVKVYDVDSEGLPGEMVAGITAKMSELFGTQAIANGQNGIKGFTLKEPIEVQGSFFVVLELPKVVPSASDYFGLVSTEDRTHADCTSYCFAEDTWLPMTEVLADGGNLSFMLIPNYIFDGVDTGIAEAQTQEELKPVFAGDLLRIDAEAGTVVTVTDLSGRTVSRAILTDGIVSVGNLPAGVYLVSVKDGDRVKTAKIVKK